MLPQKQKMRLFFGFILIVILLPTVPALNRVIQRHVENICNLRGSPTNYKPIYQSFKSITELLEEDMHNIFYSTGFHLTPEVCKDIFHMNGVTLRTPITFYPSDNQIVLFAKFGFNAIVTKSYKSIDLNIMDINFVPMEMKTKSVLWIKESVRLSGESHSYKFQYISGHLIHDETNDLKESLVFGDQHILEDISFNSFPNLNLENKVNVTIIRPNNDKIEDWFYENFRLNDSYIIVCLEDRGDSVANCDVELDENNGIYCKCKISGQLFGLLLFLIFWAVFAAFCIRPVFKLVSDKGEAEKTDFPMAMSCNQRNAKFEYIICMRFARATADFDLTDVFVDIEFLTPNSESVATPFRFKANILEKQLITQIRIFMWRLTPLPDLKKVKCSHSGRSDGKIMIFGVYVYCRKGTDIPELKMYRINRSITRDQCFFNMSIDDIKDSKAFEDEEKQLKSLTQLESSYTFLEILWILFVNITLIALVVAIFPSISSYFTILLETHTFINSLIIIGFSALVATVFNFCLTFFYRTLLLAELRQQAKMNQLNERIFYVIIRVTYVISIFICICFGLIIGFSESTQKYVDTYYYFCLIFCSTNLFVFIWVFFIHFCKFMSRSNDDAIGSSDDKTVSSIGSKNESRDQ